MSIFAETLLILRVIESHLIGVQENSNPFIGNFKRLFWYPFKFLSLGVTEKTKSASLWAFLSFSFLLLGLWLINKSGLSNTIVTNFIFYASTLISMVMVLFAVPSMYGTSGISQESVDFVVKHLHSRGFTDAKDLDLLKKSIKPFEDRARSRVTLLKWLVGLLWAGFIYFFTKSTGTTAVVSNSFMENLLTTTALFLTVAVAYIVVWGYEASLDKVFRLVEFGCNDYSHVLAHTASSTALPEK